MESNKKLAQNNKRKSVDSEDSKKQQKVEKPWKKRATSAKSQQEPEPKKKKKSSSTAQEIDSDDEVSHDSSISSLPSRGSFGSGNNNRIPWKGAKKSSDLQQFPINKENISATNGAISAAVLMRERELHTLELKEAQRKFNIEKQSLESKISSLEDQRIKNISMYQMNIQTLTAAKEALKEQLNNANSTGKQREEELKKLDGKYHDLKKKYKERRNSDKSKSPSPTEMEELKEKLEKEIKERYQKQLTELNALHVNEIEAVNRECAATVRKARSDLETAQKQAELSQLELETLRQEHKAIVEEYDAIQIEFNTFKNETHEGAKVIYEKTQNDRQRFMDLDADVETLMKKLESTNSMNHDLQKAYNEALEEIKKYEGRASKPGTAPSTPSKTSPVKNIINSARSGSSFVERKLQTENSSLKSHINRLETAANQQKIELEKLRTEKERLRNVSEQKQETLKRKVKALEGQLDKRGSLDPRASSITPVNESRVEQDFNFNRDLEGASDHGPSPTKNVRFTNPGNQRTTSSSITDLFSTSPLVKTPAGRRHYGATAARGITGLPTRTTASSRGIRTVSNDPSLVRTTGARTKPNSSPSILATPEENVRGQGRRLANNRTNPLRVSEFSATPFISKLRSTNTENNYTSTVGGDRDVAMPDTPSRPSIPSYISAPRADSVPVEIGTKRKASTMSSDAPRSTIGLSRISRASSVAASTGSISDTESTQHPRKKVRRQLSTRPVVELGDAESSLTKNKRINQSPTSNPVTTTRRVVTTTNPRSVTSARTTSSSSNKTTITQPSGSQPTGRTTFAQSFTAKFNVFGSTAPPPNSISASSSSPQQAKEKEGLTSASTTPSKSLYPVQEEIAAAPKANYF